MLWTNSPVVSVSRTVSDGPSSDLCLYHVTILGADPFPFCFLGYKSVLLVFLLSEEDSCLVVFLSFFLLSGIRLFVWDSITSHLISLNISTLTVSFSLEPYT